MITVAVLSFLALSLPGSAMRAADCEPGGDYDPHDRTREIEGVAGESVVATAAVDSFEVAIDVVDGMSALETTPLIHDVLLDVLPPERHRVEVCQDGPGVADVRVSRDDAPIIVFAPPKIPEQVIDEVITLTSVIDTPGDPASPLTWNVLDQGGHFVLELGIDAGERIAITVFDVRGRATARLHRGRVSEGRHRWSLDGRGEGGVPLGSGVYSIQLSTRLGTRTSKVTIAR